MISRYMYERGRSMVEILGVLAITGVLSIGGIMGYSYGMDKYRASRTMRDVHLRAVDVLSQFNETGDATLDGWKNEQTIYPITLEDETIGIQVNKVPERVCEMIAEGMQNSVAAIKINAEYVEEDVGDCGDNNTMVFYFDEGITVESGSYPECPTEPILSVIACDGEEGPQICLMGECIPDGITWCEPDVECPIDRGCVAEGLPLVGANCQKNGKQGKCDGNGQCNTDINDEPLVCGGVNCVEYITSFVELYEQETGERFPYTVPPKECMTCIDDACSVVPLDGDMGLCLSDTFAICGNMDVNLPICMPLVSSCESDADCSQCQSCIDGVCQSGDGVCTTSDGRPGMCDYEDSCYACDTSYPFEPNNPSACSIVCPEREVSPNGWYCALACSPDKPLQETDGYCNSCDTTYSAYVGTDGKCSEVCPNRVKVNSYCILACGQGNNADQPLTDVTNEWEVTCHACSSTTPIYVGKDGKCSDVCPGRILTSGGYCAQPCPADKPLMASDGTCHSCTEEKGIFVGSNGQCSEVCPDRSLLSSGYCGQPCPEDKPLANTQGTCYSCDEEVSVAVGSDGQCHEICSNRVKSGSSCRLNCGEGDLQDKPLVDTDGRCHSCDEETGITVGSSGKCTEVCPNRINTEYYKGCRLNCGEGDLEDKPLVDANGKCHACDEEGEIYVSSKECSSICPNRVKDGIYCAYCPSDRPLWDWWTSKCQPCDTSLEVKYEYFGCTEVCPNRVDAGSYCYLPHCSGDKPLMDINGDCYACDDNKDINIGSMSTCTDVCSKRVKEGNYCRLKCGEGDLVDKPLRDSDGGCHSCNEGKSIDVGVNGKCTEVCSNLEKNERGYCAEFSCSSDMPLMSYAGNCFSCSDTRTIAVEFNGKCSEVCSNRVMLPRTFLNYDVCALSCSNTKPLMDTSGTCYACSYNRDVNVGENGKCSEVCPERIKEGSSCRLKCGEGELVGTPLMSSVGSCYACDNKTDVSIPTNGKCKEICPNRDIVEGGYCGIPCSTDKPLRNYSGSTCYSCDYEHAVDVGIYGICSEICPNRELKSGDCKLSCENRPLVNTEGTCYSCDTQTFINVGADGKCTEVCPNRIKSESGMCGFSVTCPADKPLLTRFGVCEACTTGSVNINSSVFELGYHVEMTGSCSGVCSNRQASYDPNDGYMLCWPKCSSSTPLRDSRGTCRACDFETAIAIVDGLNCKSLCPSREVINIKKDGVNQWCATSCSSSKPLRDYDLKCHACDETEDIYIGSIGLSCSELCPNRIQEGDYCKLK